jgi:hypothetical protein
MIMALIRREMQIKLNVKTDSGMTLVIALSSSSSYLDIPSNLFLLVHSDAVSVYAIVS